MKHSALRGARREGSGHGRAWNLLAALLAISTSCQPALAQVPATCAISGTVLNAQSQPVVGTNVRIRTVKPTAFGNYGITTQDLTTITDASGNWSLTVTQGLKAQIDIPAVSLFDDIIVPTGASCPATFASLTLYARGTLTPATIISQTGPAFGGDLTGNSPNPSVIGLRGVPLILGTPTDGQSWIYSSGSGGYVLGNPLTGTFSPSSNVVLLQSANATSGAQQQPSFLFELTGSVWNVGGGTAETRLFSLRNTPTGFNAGKLSFLTYNGNGGIGSEVASVDTSGNFTGNFIGGLTGNATGNVSGTAGSFTGSLTGDVTSTGMATTVVQVGSYSAANVAAGATLANAATTNNTASTIVRRDGSGNFTAGQITATTFVGALTGNASGSAASFTGSLVGDVTGTQGATSVVKIRGNMVNSAGPTNGQVLTWVTGNSDWEPATPTGLVSSVSGAGGGTGLTLAGGPTGAVTLTLGGTLGLGYGGTGQTTAGAAFNALAPTITLGDTIYANGSGTNTKLSGNTSSTKNFYTQTGNGSVSAAPAWGTIASGDLPGSIAANTSGTAANVTGIVVVANGGTGQSTAATGFAALAPYTTLGDLVYENATPTPTRLPGNTSATKAWLNQTGNGSISAAPLWSAIAAGDLPANLTSNTSGTAANVTGVVAIANGGTGQSGAGTAFNALSPLTTLGDTLYGGASGSGTRLGGNTTVTPMFLKQTGNGSVSAAPAWFALGSADIPANAANTSGTAASFTGALTGDVTSSGMATSVVKLQGRAVSSTAPTSGYVLTWVAGNSDWEPQNPGGGGGVSSVSGSGGTTGLTLTGGPTGAVTLTLGGTLAVADGGTGQTTALAGFAALAPYSTLGDLVYENATPTPARLAGNTTSTKNFLVQTGNGSISAAPAWGTIAAADLPGSITSNTSGTAANVTGTVVVGNGGTGTTTFASGAFLIGNGASAIGVQTLPITVAQGGSGATSLTGVLRGTGTTAFTTGAINLSGADVTNTLGVANGGTGATTLTGLLHGNGTSAVTAGQASLTADVSGILPVANGGSGASTLTGYLKGNGSSAFTAQTTPIPLADGGTAANFSSTGGTSYVIKQTSIGAALTSAALVAGDIPALPASQITSGSFGVAQGGTGSATFAAGYLKSPGGTTALTSQAVPIPVTDGGSGTTTQFTLGSVLFAGASGVYSQDNAKLFWDDTNYRLGVGITAPATALDLNGAAQFENMAAPAVAPSNTGRIYYDTTANAFKVSQNTGAYVTLLGAGALSGSGVANQLAFFNSANSITSQSAFNVDTVHNYLGVNQTVPAYTLDVGGDANITGAYRVSGSVVMSTPGATSAYVGGYPTNLCLGAYACTGITSLSTNTYNLFAGYGTAKNITTGIENVGLGGISLNLVTTGGYNTAIGYSSLGNATTANSNVAIGTNAGNSITTGYNNVAIGQNSGLPTSGTGYYNVWIGTSATSSIDTINSMAIGANVSVGASNAVALGNATQKIGIHQTNPSTTLDVAGAVSMEHLNIAVANGLNSNIALTDASFIRLTGPTSTFSIGGFTNGADGRILYIYNTVAYAMTIVNEDASSTAANRIWTMTGANIVLRAGTSFATLIYSSADSRWLVVATN